MSLSVATGIRSTLPALRPVLARWAYLNSRIGTAWARDYSDCPWWYNERASLSFFAGAVWNCGGWALEEFSSTKKTESPNAPTTDRTGRYDINFAIGHHEYLAEAKQCWPRISSPSAALARIKETLRRASGDARAVIPHGLPVLSMVFAVPLVPLSRSSGTTGLLRSFIAGAMTTKGVSLAWAFPLAARTLSSPDSTYAYPGVMIIVRLVRKAA